MPETVLRLEAAQLTAPSGEVILAGVDGEVERGQPLVVVGPSGSGKSRLLRLWNRLDALTGGRAWVLGREVQAWHPGELRRRVGWVPQRPHMGDGTAGDALDVPRALGLVAADQLAPRITEALAIVGLDPALRERPLSRLSGGELSRVAIARALTLEPEVLMLDEPTSALDGERAAAVLDGLLSWARARDATCVVVTHRLDDVERIGGQLWVLRDGRVDRRGPVGELAGDADVRRLMTGREQEAS